MSAIEQGAQPRYRIDLRSAVDLAQRYLHELVPQELNALRLEEIEIDRDSAVWSVTLGYEEARPVTTESAPTLASLIRPKREYKVITLDANTGDFVSMKLRNV